MKIYIFNKETWVALLLLVLSVAHVNSEEEIPIQVSNDRLQRNLANLYKEKDSKEVAQTILLFRSGKHILFWNAESIRKYIDLKRGSVSLINEQECKEAAKKFLVSGLGIDKKEAPDPISLMVYYSAGEKEALIFYEFVVKDINSNMGSTFPTTVFIPVFCRPDACKVMARWQRAEINDTLEHRPEEMDRK